VTDEVACAGESSHIIMQIMIYTTWHACNSFE